MKAYSLVPCVRAVGFCFLTHSVSSCFFVNSLFSSYLIPSAFQTLSIPKSDLLRFSVNWEILNFLHCHHDVKTNGLSPAFKDPAHHPRLQTSSSTPLPPRWRRKRRNIRSSIPILNKTSPTLFPPYMGRRTLLLRPAHRRHPRIRLLRSLSAVAALAARTL